MKIGQVTINKMSKKAILIQRHLCRIIILFSLARPWRSLFSKGTFTETVREPGGILVQEKASYINIGPLFIMYTRPDSG